MAEFLAAQLAFVWRIEETCSMSALYFSTLKMFHIVEFKMFQARLVLRGSRVVCWRCLFMS
jgi:hypothetical protein